MQADNDRRQRFSKRFGTVERNRFLSVPSDVIAGPVRPPDRDFRCNDTFAVAGSSCGPQAAAVVSESGLADHLPFMLPAGNWMRDRGAHGDLWPNGVIFSAQGLFGAE